MTGRLLRTQILLEPQQHQALREIAQQERRSLSDVVREMLQAQLLLRQHNALEQQRRHLEALERIRAHRQAIFEERGGRPLAPDTVDLINQMREERDAEIIGHRD